MRIGAFAFIVSFLALVIAHNTLLLGISVSFSKFWLGDDPFGLVQRPDNARNYLVVIIPGRYYFIVNLLKLSLFMRLHLRERHSIRILKSRGCWFTKFVLLEITNSYLVYQMGILRRVQLKVDHGCHHWILGRRHNILFNRCFPNLGLLMVVLWLRKVVWLNCYFPPGHRGGINRCFPPVFLDQV